MTRATQPSLNPASGNNFSRRVKARSYEQALTTPLTFAGNVLSKGHGAHGSGL